jgi:hypothetical protein
MLRAIAGAGLLAALPAGAMANDARWPGPQAGASSVRVLIAPFGPLVSLVERVAGGEPLPSTVLAVPPGPRWHVVGAEIQAPARALLISVTGRVEFQTAEIVLADGAIERVDLAGAQRSRGVYALREWPEARDVLGVRVSARAPAGGAAIGFLLVR